MKSERQPLSKTPRGLLNALKNSFDTAPRVSDKATRLYAKAGQLEVLELAESLVTQWEDPTHVLE